METIHKTITIGGQAIEIREPTIAAIRAWLGELMTPSRQDVAAIVDDMLIQDHTLKALPLLTNLDAEGVGGLTPGQARELLAACREVNPDFFGLLERVLTAIKATARSSSGTSNAAPSP